MDRAQIDALERASRAAMAYVSQDEPERYSRLVTATVPALGILAACAIVLFAVL